MARMRKFAVVIAVAALTSSCSRTTKVEAVADPSEAPTVAVAKVTTEDLSRNLELTAEFRPFQEVDVMAKVRGWWRNRRSTTRKARTWWPRRRSPRQDPT